MSSPRVNLIPLAGAGQRFIDAGYSVPKPLIDVAGLPMILRAAAALPKTDQWLFVCRGEHIDHYQIDDVLRQTYPGANVVRLDELTEGQLCTCLIGARQLPPDANLQIGACDNGMEYDADRFDRMQGDVVVWTFRGNPAVRENPAMYGWVRVNDQDRVTCVSCKVPISDAPENDHAVIGAFTFRRVRDFVAIADKCIADNRRINGEFYIDEAVNTALEMELDVRVFEVDRYVCWGTPRELTHFLDGDRV